MPTYKYPRPALTIDAIVFGVLPSGLCVLLIQRGGEPFKGRWALPGGFVNVGEDVDAAARRELREETKLKPAHIEQLKTFGAPDRDPREHVVTVAYLALVSPSAHELKAGSDAKRVQWFPVDELPRLAFDHRAIFDEGLARLRSKVRYAPIGFDLLEPEFSLRDLQRLYETILGRQLDRRNFRVKILGKGFLRATGGKSKTRPPAELYRFDRDEYDRLTKLGLNLEI